MIGLILGPAAEQHLRRALAISQGDWTVFLTRPLSAALLRHRGDLSLWGIVRMSAPDKCPPGEIPIESNHEAE